jgi:hypothetical protein
MEKWQKQVINGMYGIKKGEMKMVSYGGRGHGKSTIAQRYWQAFAEQQKLMEQCIEKGYTKVVISPDQMTTANRSAMIEWCKQNCKKDFSSFVAAYGFFFFESKSDAEFFALVW